MWSRRRFLGLLAFLPWGVAGVAQARSLVGVREGLTDRRNRVVFEFDSKVYDVRHFTIDSPPRFVLDVGRAKIAASAPRSPRFSEQGIVSGLRSHVSKENGNLRLVLDLRRLARFEFEKWPTQDGKGDRLVVDFLGKFAPPAPRKPATATRPSTRPSRTPARSGRGRPLIVMIDPGHGGKDPGAVGRGKTREKDVVLSISRKLHGLLRADPRIRPYLTRDRDVFLSLSQRTRIARSRQADLFVSVHADAARRRSARGASVYALSTRGSSSAHARWLADRENAADLKGDVEISGRNPVVQDVLLSMSRGAVQEYSLHAGKLMVDSLRPIGAMHSTRVERAGFAVLKSPDIPSILVETGFISNAREEKLLRSSKHQQRVARALHRGIRSYFSKVPEYG